MQTPKKNKVVRAVETDLAKAEILRRGLTVEAIAALVGLEAVTVGNQLRTNFRSLYFRDALEARVFHYALPIWSSATRLLSRRDAADRIGVDPCLLRDRDELRRLARRIGVRGNVWKGTVEDIIEMILAHLAANPNLHLATTAPKTL